MKTTLLIMMFVAAASPGSAADRRDLGQSRWNESSHVNCETVRAYVAQWDWRRLPRWLVLPG
jgi:hypothetical protein